MVHADDGGKNGNEAIKIPLIRIRGSFADFIVIAQVTSAQLECPNMLCADALELEGCFGCTELPECDIGCFSERGGEFASVAKASALFIRQHGQDAFSETLRAVIADGNAYPEYLNEMGSCEVWSSSIVQPILPGRCIR